MTAVVGGSNVVIVVGDLLEMGDFNNNFKGAQTYNFPGLGEVSVTMMGNKKLELQLTRDIVVSIPSLAVVSGLS